MSSSVPGHAADAENGKKLHDASCITPCHAQRVNGTSNQLYTRENNKKTLEALRAQVATCNQMVLSSKWFPEDEADVVEYLNKEFYHLK
ncbi:MAG: cytochrome c [Magnetococcales bacterium]|nr:cytochrome c [Magnetococcales bacterium]